VSIARYVDYRHRFPRPIQVGDLVIEEADREATYQRLEEAFDQPVILRYLDQQVGLAPDAVGFRLFAERMLDGVWDQTSLQLEATDFLAVTLGGTSRPLVVPVVADCDPRALWRELQRVADQCDRPSRPPQLVKTSLRFLPGEPAQRLDIEASLPQVVGALLSPTQRQVDLTVIQGEEEGLSSGVSLSHLQPAVEALVADFPGVVGVFVKDLATGEEMALSGEVAFAGMSLLKVAIVEEFFRRLDRAPTTEEMTLLTETLTQVGNSTSNLLLARIGEGDPYQGARWLTESMRRIGLVNTFMASPYNGDNRSPPHILTPANSRHDVDTEPDPYIQTTPQDVGLFLEMIYQGATGGGTLIAAYPGEITPEECEAILEIMKGSRLGSMFEEGVPEGTPVAHKYGWIADTHADAGIIFSPGGDYLLVVFVYRQDWLPWDQSAPLIADIAHIVYNYFNMDAQW
jgi:beta-lactamase class A